MRVNKINSNSCYDLPFGYAYEYLYLYLFTYIFIPTAVRRYQTHHCVVVVVVQSVHLLKGALKLCKETKKMRVEYRKPRIYQSIGQIGIESHEIGEELIKDEVSSESDATMI